MKTQGTVEPDQFYHFLKSVCIRSFSFPYFPAFGNIFSGLNTGKHRSGKFRVPTLFTNWGSKNFLTLIESKSPKKSFF